MAAQKAVVINECGGVGALKVVTDFPMPERKEGQVLVKLTSTCVNPVDTYVRNGAYAPKSFPKCLGGDVAGIVEEADGGSKFKKGDKVFALTTGFVEGQFGTYCQYASVAEADLAYIPDSLPLDEAGAVPLVALTAWQALEPAGAAPGLRVFINAAAGGVGHMAVQIAKARGAHVVGTAGPNNVEYLKQIGCDEVVNYREQDAGQLYADAPFDICVDMVGGAEQMELLYSKLAKKGGWYSHILNRGTDQAVLEKLKQGEGEKPNVHTVFVHPSGSQLAEIADLIKAGKVKPHVQSKYPLEEAAKAHAEVETWHVRGKVVLTIN